jgi:plasmid stability protein
LDDTVKSSLRIRFATHGRSMEEEAREILRQALLQENQPGTNLAERIRRHIDPVGGVELILPKR